MEIALLDPASALLAQVARFLPRLLLALLIIAVGWLLSKALRIAVVRLLRGINAHVITERAGIDELLRQMGLGLDSVHMLGVLSFWFGMTITLVVATGALGLDHASDLVGRFALFLSRLFLTLIVIAVGAYFARVVAEVVRVYCERNQIGDAIILARLAHVAVIVFVTLIAIDALGIGGQIVQYAFLMVLGGVIFALALAFGLAGRKWAALLLERWWPRGQREP